LLRYVDINEIDDFRMGHYQPIYRGAIKTAGAAPRGPILQQSGFAHCRHNLILEVCADLIFR